MNTMNAMTIAPVPIRLHVNGQPVSAQAAPRTLLGDFLREDLRLTGLHLACDHGVCGGCNVEIDGRLSRSCTQLAVRCDGRQVRTIEGFGDDLLMRRLRAAFSAEHALQCGYCTPGMLMTAHDIVRRFPAPDEATVRRELSGNLCRCTGYAGIVKAVLKVAHERADWATIAAPPQRQDLARAVALPSADGAAPAAREMPEAAPAAGADAEARIPDPRPLPAEGADAITRAFTLPAPRERVWRLFGDVRAVAGCMPGLAVEAVQDNERLRGVFTVKAGPIRAVFATIARVGRDAASWSGRVESEGRDRLTRSATVARLDYRLLAADAQPDAATRIEIRAAFHIEGRLAEFSRPEVVAALATQLTERFAANVAQRLAGGDAGAGAHGAAAEALDLSLAGMARAWLGAAWRALAAWARRVPPGR